MSEALFRSVESLTDIYGMRVMVRTSLDVPIKDGVVQNDFRVLQAIPTIMYLIEKGARVIILTHVGRDPENSTHPLFSALAKHIPVTYVHGVIGREVERAVAHMKTGSALLLENVRGHSGEDSNDLDFARTLASYADFYVNDAFAVSHRSHASIVGIPQFIPSFAGITFGKEYVELRKALTPENPSLFILGGAKFETKAPLVSAFAQKYTNSFIGGVLANDFLKAKGYEVGESRTSPIDLRHDPAMSMENVLIPIDVVVISKGTSHETARDTVLPDEKIVDAGTKTVEMLAPYIKNAKTILWNGPFGNYEEGFDSATKACAELIAQSGAFSIVGGGDTVAAIESLGLEEKFGFLSTAGGAMLEFLEKGTLPGIEALQK